MPPHELIYNFCIDHPHFPIAIDNIVGLATITGTNTPATKENIANLTYEQGLTWDIDTVDDKFNIFAPVYIEEFPAKLPDGTPVWCVRHLLFYAFNIGYKGFGCLPKRVGQHLGDFEEVVLIYTGEDEANRTLYGMFTFAHGMGREARLTLAKDILFTGPRINVWVARNSNAHIPTGRSRVRFFGFANDVVSSHGLQWTPVTQIKLQDCWWYGLPAFRWGGADGPRNPQPIPQNFIAQWEEKKRKDYAGLLVC